MFLFTAELTSVSLSEKDKYGLYLTAILHEVNMGQFSCKVRAREWPLQHLGLLLGSQLEFLPLKNNKGLLLPLNNQSPLVMGELVNKLLMSGEIEMDRTIENNDFYNPDGNFEVNEELNKKRKELEQIFRRSDNQSEEIDEDSDEEDIEQDDLPF